MHYTPAAGQPWPARVATIVLVALACVAFAPPLAVDGRFSHLEYALIVLAGSLIIAAFCPSTGRTAVPTPLVVLIGWMGLSGLWGVSRMQSAHDVATFAAIFLAGLVLVQIADLNTLAVGVATSGILLLLWTLALAVRDPGSVVTSTAALIGPYGNRNGFAYALLTAVSAALAIRTPTLWPSIARWGSVLALSVAIVATSSRTATIVLAAAFVTAAVIFLARRRRAYALAIVGVLVAAVVVAAVNSSAVLSFLGKNGSINGRLPIWRGIVPLIGERPLQGFGWSMAWPVNGAPSGAARWKLGGVTVYHAHNELLNWLITTGIVGAILIVATYALVVWGGIRLLRRTSDPSSGGHWLLIGAVVFILRGISDISETLPQGWFVLAILAAAAAAAVRTPEPNGLARWTTFSVTGPRTADHLSKG